MGLGLIIQRRSHLPQEGWPESIGMPGRNGPEYAPVRAGLVKRPEQWKGSSYRATAGGAKKPVFLKLIGFFRRFGVGVQRRKRRTGGMHWKDCKESRLGRG